MMDFSAFKEDETIQEKTFFEPLADFHQSPDFTISFGDRALENEPSVVFSFPYCILEFYLEGYGEYGNDKIKKWRATNPDWFTPTKNFETPKAVACIEISTRDPITVGLFNLLSSEEQRKWRVVLEGLQNGNIVLIPPFPSHNAPLKDMFTWLSLLQGKILNNLQPVSHLEDAGNVRRGFWWYYGCVAETDKEDLSPMEPYPWMWLNKDGRLQYNPQPVIRPYFLDSHERKLSLVPGLKVERQEQIFIIERIFNENRVHKATICLADNGNKQIHVSVVKPIEYATGEIPELPEKTEARFKLTDNSGSPTAGKGKIIQIPTAADFVLVTRHCLPLNDLGPQYDIFLEIKPNLRPIEDQIAAVIKSGEPEVVFGDKPENRARGFSLHRTVLAHGCELDPSHESFFKWSILERTSLDLETAKWRINSIKKACRLDTTQLEAYEKSLFYMVAGMSLVQGPPGTGKSHLGVAIIVTIASLGFKVLLTAGSNKAVDSLSAAVAKFLNRNPEVKTWCGKFVRARTPGYQLGLFHELIVGSSESQGPAKNKTDADTILEGIQIPLMVKKLVDGHPYSSKYMQRFVGLISDYKSAKGQLSADKSKAFKGDYELVAGEIAKEGSIVASTLSNSAHEFLLRFEPDFVICDESGQCTEGESMIALSKPSVKAFVLLGDPQQLAPTIITEKSAKPNPEVKFIKRSLMERLKEAGYPYSMLRTNYRCHPEVLDFFNRSVYKGQLTKPAGFVHDGSIGYIWDSFTRNNRDLVLARQQNKRRVFLTVDSVATKPENSTSWVNHQQANVALDLLKDLYKHKAPDGRTITPVDAMLISPYKAQRNLLTEKALERGIPLPENLTVDASQGQEANIVIYMLVKPSADSKQIGFVADSRRLNVALSRAKDALVIIGNLKAWNKQLMEEMKNNKTHAVLRKLLADVQDKSNIVPVRLKDATPSSTPTPAPLSGVPPPPRYAEPAAAPAPILGALPPPQNDEMDIDSNAGDATQGVVAGGAKTRRPRSPPTDMPKLTGRLKRARVDPPEGPSSRTLSELGSVRQLSEEYRAIRNAEMKALDLVLGLGQQIRVLEETADQVEARFCDVGPGLERLKIEFEEAEEAHKEVCNRRRELENAGKKYNEQHYV
ncbi:hypothetical protein PISL3812_06957 [Talaromyces islandicus]|uniref:Uncharacterized protein n=1 Tax=Talaromyces islandicus TaxID=28573 RepID=A0A0U1M2V3_TALIS|nr:hypothetical protein PISL3812_06957 [Talaromyces islandicus]